MYMRGSGKFCQRGSNLIFLINEGIEDPNTTINGVWADDGPTFNAGLVAL